MSMDVFDYIFEYVELTRQDEGEEAYRELLEELKQTIQDLIDTPSDDVDDSDDIDEDSCCENESRNMNGRCDNCGDPCL